MSMANEPQFAMDQLVETNESKKKPRISYTREFLLSLSDKDICKKLPNLPSEFHDSLLRDSEDPSPERVRVSGDFSTHGFRRNDYSSSPPTRGDFGNSRGIHGRWEGRSSGWSDKDSDSQSDRDSGESGRRTGMPSRRPWQSPEHDGLLGKGSFPKPSGFAAGTSGSRHQSNEPYHPPRSNEPYHPPKSNEPYHPSRPYKAAPYTRRDTRDSFNDETFGSSDSTSEDRAEEERKRRASFELLRKEHQKAFQERQKLNPDLRKNDFDFSELLGESKDEKGRPSRSDEVNNTPTVPGSNNTFFPSQSNAARPLVPPGFASTILERKQGEKPQIETSQHERSSLNSKGINMLNGTSVNNEENPSGIKIGSNELVEGEDVRVSSTDASERAVNMSSFLGISTDKSVEKLSSISNPAETHGYPRKSEEATVTLDKNKSSEISDGPSILDKLFNTAINLNSGDSSNITVKNVEKVEETRSPQIIQSSSKFAHLFLEEDNKPVEDLQSTRPPRDLLSLLHGADKSQTFDANAKNELSTDFPFQGHATNSTDQLSNTSTRKSVTAVPPVLTCEDLEQSILSEVSESYHPPPPPPLANKDSSVSSVKKTKQRKTSVDDQASQHLLSLLQRGSDPKDQDTQVHSVIDTRPPPSVKKPGTPGEADPGKSLTLENLFGSAFMNELQSIGEPVTGRATVSDSLRSDKSIGELSQRNQIRPDGLDPANPQKYMSFPGSLNQEPEVTYNISEKLAALNSGPRNGRPTMGGQDSPFLQQYVTDPSSHLNGSGPMFHQFDSRHANLKPQLDFTGPRTSIAQHHDPPPNHQFSPFHHMHMQGFPSGGPQHHHHSPHVNNQMPPSLIPELNPSQGFPFANRQPNYGSQVNRSDHQASLQTLLGLHQRMDPSKPMGQTGDPNRQGSMGHELDLGFGYR